MSEGHLRQHAHFTDMLSEHQLSDEITHIISLALFVVMMIPSVPRSVCLEGVTSDVTLMMRDV
jgi:hypothetical protein